MKRISTYCQIAFAVMAFGTLGAEEKKPQIDSRLKKGQGANFVLKRTSSSESSGGQGGLNQKEETEIHYRLEVSDLKENGDLELKVTYGKVKSIQEGRDSKWEFDSASKEGGDEAAQHLRGVIAKPITVKVSGGKIAEVTGFPEVDRPQQGGGGGGDAFRVYSRKTLLSRRSLQGDLDQILARTVRGQPLESGKEYQPAAEENTGAGGQGGGQGNGQGGGRGRFAGGMQNLRLIYKYQGEEKVGDVPAAKFSLAAAPATRARAGGGGGGTRENKSEGTALVSLKDGLLWKLEVSSASKSEGERNGNSFKSSRTSKTSIAREEGEKGAKKDSV